VNLVRPLWLRSKDNITKLEYDDFYKSLTHSFETPLGYAHFAGEGEVEFKVIFFFL
jgi:molecular chaperone HtpG